MLWSCFCIVIWLLLKNCHEGLNQTAFRLVRFAPIEAKIIVKKE
uniref:Uncharacterized protein n=1 Tax=Rhizophora mucronata TaxID=61149 RepID=A0A2P2Q9P4_RHIMU